MSIRGNIETVRENIARAAERSGRSAEDILLLAVSKTVGPDKMQEAFDAGIRDFGENRVQEFLKKEEFFCKKANFHIIGQLQKNKVKYIIGHIEMLHSLCSVSVAAEIQRLCEKMDATQDCLIQINTSHEESKSGVPAEEAERLIEEIAPFDRVRVKGLMTIGARDALRELARPYFRQLRNVFDRLSSVKTDNFEMRHLSMGMTSDYEAAIEEGADIVRVGSAIFGERAPG